MKEMIYSDERKVELLYNNVYKNFHYYILNLGTHPTAYIEIPKKHSLFRKNYLDIEDIDVHGGLTYSSSKLYIAKNCILENSWFIGWDYAHFDDYCGFLPFNNYDFKKKWITEEIIKECKNVIEQIDNIKEKNNE